MSGTTSKARWRLHVGAARAVQAFDAGAVTPKDSLEINFEATRLRQYGTRDARPRQSEAAVRPRASGLVILSGSIAENIHFVRRRPPHEQVAQALARAAAHWFTAPPREEYGTLIGKRGVTSQSANARAAIARAR